MSITARDRAETSLPDGLVSTWVQLLPYLSLFVRVGVGLALLNGGLAGVMQTAAGRGFNGGFGPMSRFSGAGSGLDGLYEILPYAQIALGLGLTLGMFTTTLALLSCGLMVALPLMMTFLIVTTASVGGGNFGGGPRLGPIGTEFAVVSLLVPLATSPCLVLLVLLSPRSINRFSIDTLIFGQRPKVAREDPDAIEPS